MSDYVLLKRLQVQNANALSSPFTFGFPAVTAFLGFAHALQRQLNPTADPDELLITGVGIISHALDLQDHQENYSRTLRLTANPLDKDGSRPSFVEEGRCHLTVSLVLEVENLPNGRARENLIRDLPNRLLARCKLAGGDILSVANVQILADNKAGLRALMPGYALLERRDLMLEAMQAGQDALDALHGLLQIRHRSTLNADEKTATWYSSRAQAGWIVPIAVGYHALTAVGMAAQQRDEQTPHRFVESVITVGEFVMPYRLNGLADLIWRYQHAPDSAVYLCSQV